MILCGGYDSTAEELYFQQQGRVTGPRLRRADRSTTPAKGSALLERGMVMRRPDWEAVITPVVDFVLDLTGVDPNRIALMGLSLGGYLGAAVGQRRGALAACITDGGEYDLFGCVAGTDAGPGGARLRRGPLVVDRDRAGDAGPAGRQPR